MNFSITALVQAIIGGRKNLLRERAKKGERNNDKSFGKRKAYNTFKGICGGGNKRRRMEVTIAAQAK